jgi:ubiquinone/menaquinone biosynthesis C-methylase UbiE
MKPSRKKVLEIGCSHHPLQRTLAIFLKRLPREVEYHGVDICEFSGAQKRHNRKVANFHRMDGRSLAFRGDCFDEVHTNFLLTDDKHVTPSDRIQILKEIRRVLKDEGMVVIAGETRDKDSSIPDFKAEIRKLLQQDGFSMKFVTGDIDGDDPPEIFTAFYSSFSIAGWTKHTAPIWRPGSKGFVIVAQAVGKPLEECPRK